MKYTTILIVVFLLNTSFAVDADAPFGLQWGMNPKQVEELGAEFIDKTNDARLTIYRATSLPQNLSISGAYILVFDMKYQLQKLIMGSTPIEGDVFGSQGRQLYADMKFKLSNKYGNPTAEIEKVGNIIYEEADEFYQCLAYTGCGYWQSLFEPKTGGTVAIELRGLKRGEGYIRFSYEGPNWHKVSEANRKIISTKDENAL